MLGCIAYAHIPDANRKKLDQKVVKLRFVGYDITTKAYRLMDDKTGLVYKRRDVTFNEDDFGHKEASTVSTGDSSRKKTGTTEADQPVENEAKSEKSAPHPERPKREVKQPVRYGYDEYAEVMLKAVECPEPRTLQEALSSNQPAQWKEAADAEYQSLLDSHTWDLVKLPSGRKSIGCKWVFKVKHSEDGSVEKFKGRLVAKGFAQRYGVDYDETFSPIVRFTTIRSVIALAAEKKMHLHQMDVVSAFLNGDLEEEIYMDQPEGYVQQGKEDLVCQLKKSLYGLKQSPRCWNRKLSEYLCSIGFTQGSADPCIYIKTGDSLMIVAVYVDDLILAAEDFDDMVAVKRELSSRFKMKDMGELHFILGMGVEWDKRCGTVKLQQTQYIKCMLRKFGMADANPVSTPADTSVKLIQDDGMSTRVDSSKYQSMVGSLLWAAISTRPDIAQAVSTVSRFNKEPSQAHLTAVKRILRYLKGTADLGIVYGPTSGTGLLGFSDANWAGDHDDRRSTTGNVFLFSRGPVSWLSQRQKIVALSTTEAEYMALGSATQELIWVRRLLADLKSAETDSTVVYEDNQGPIALVKNPVAHKRTKHIDIRHHFVREEFENGTLNVQYCPTKDMLADLLTKPLSRCTFEHLRESLGMK